jgi:hypothetical protein
MRVGTRTGLLTVAEGSVMFILLLLLAEEGSYLAVSSLGGKPWLDGCPGIEPREAVIALVNGLCEGGKPHQPKASVLGLSSPYLYPCIYLSTDENQGKRHGIRLVSRTNHLVDLAALLQAATTSPPTFRY